MRVCSGCCVVLRWVIVSSADCDGAAPGGLNVYDLYVRVAAGDARMNGDPVQHLHNPLSTYFVKQNSSMSCRGGASQWGGLRACSDYERDE